MKSSVSLAVIVLVFFTFLLPSTAHAATEYATFQSFYKESSSIGLILTAVFALVSGAVILVTGGTASPIVVGIGSWVGEMMGLSGVAATNAGLAFLGGGSIASGGFGMIGGATLLTAALSFSGNIAFNYTASKMMSEYNYTTLAESSKKMMTLPIPLNDSGPDAYEDAIKVLEGMDKETPVFSSKNQQVIKQAITALETTKTSSDRDESIKNNSLLSLLYFISNNYVNAKHSANSAIQSARKAEIKRTLPAFIYATSTLYEKTFDFESITDKYFRYSILAEPNNPIIPLLFSIYLDRMQLRFNDGFLNASSLHEIFIIMRNSHLSKIRTVDYTILLTRYFIQLKLEQQKILSLTKSSNKTIKKSRKTLEIVIDSLKQYNILINGSKDVISSLLALNLSDKGILQAAKFDNLLKRYAQYKEKLASSINDLRTYQNNALRTHQSNLDKINWIVYVIFALVIFIVLVFIKKRAQKRQR